MHLSTTVKAAVVLAVATGLFVTVNLGPEAVFAWLASGFAGAGPRLREWAGDGWIGLAKSYAQSPALVAAISVGFALPVAALGLGIARAVGRLSQRSGTARGSLRRRSEGQPLTSPMAKAWLQVEGGLAIEGRQAGRQHNISGELLRIGRAADNDLTLADQSVHDLHALIRRTPDAEFIIIDVSGRTSNGLAINGHRMTQAPLRNGDRIEMGGSAMTFHRAMALPTGHTAAAPVLRH